MLKKSHATKLYCLNQPETEKSKLVAFGKVACSNVKSTLNRPYEVSLSI